MSDGTKATGGGMCGAVSYETADETFGVIHCHCYNCPEHYSGPVGEGLPSD